MNNVSLIGRLTATPELKTTPSGKNVTNFTLAVKGYGEAVDFIDVVAWQQTAELVTKYMEKGRELGVTGRISVRNYEHDGQKRKAVEVVADSVTFIGGRSESKAEDVAPDVSGEEEVDLNLIPF